MSYGTAVKPKSFNNCIFIDNNFIGKLIISHATKVRFLVKHSLLFNNRILPLAKCLGFLYSFAKGSKSLYVHIISPSTINSSCQGILLGIFLITRALCKISSPTCPFPRVSALTSFPPKYLNEQVKPSIFAIQIGALSPKNASTSDKSFVLANESIG